MTTTSENNTVPTESEEILNLNSPLNFHNFNIEDIDMGETVNVTILIDNSYSMKDYETILNGEINLMVNKFKKIHQAFVSKLVIQKGSEEFASIEFAQTLFMFLLKNRSDLYRSLKLSDLELKDQLNIWVSVWNKKAEQHRPLMS